MITGLANQVERTAAEAGARSASVAFYDYASDSSWSYQGERWYHAASTIKVAVLVGLFAAVEAGRCRLDDRLHVHNRFISAYEGAAFSVDPAQDSNSEVHDAIGQMMRIHTLAEHMIATSSNLATNLLLDHIGVEYTRGVLTRLGVDGIELRRGVDDEAAFDAGINNRVTADGLTRLFRIIEDRRLISEEAADGMLDLLRKQQFQEGIPAGIPDNVRWKAQFAHKTGDISTVTHDAGLVYLPGREPYVVTILTEWDPDAPNRRETVARISGLVYRHVTGGPSPAALDG